MGKRNRRKNYTHRQDGAGESQSHLTNLSQIKASLQQMQLEVPPPRQQHFNSTSPCQQQPQSSAQSCSQISSGPRILQDAAACSTDKSQDKQSDETCVSICIKEELKMPCLGRSLGIGTVYNYHSEKFLLDNTLWEKDVIQKNVKLETHDRDRYEVITNDNLSKQAISLGMNASTKLNFLSGLISLKGSAEYLQNKKSSNHQARVILKYYCNTFEETLSTDYMKLEEIAYRDAVDSGLYTHVVTGVQYGFDAVFVFDRTLSPEEDCQAVEGFLVNAISKIIQGRCEEDRPVMINKQEEEEINKFHCTYHGDMLLLKNPSTVYEALQVFQSLPKLLHKTITENGIYGMTKIAYLRHLNEFGFDLSWQVQEVNCDLVDEIQSLMETYDQLQLTAIDLIKEEIYCHFPEIKQQILKFKQNVGVFVKQIEQKLATILSETRDEKETQDLLIDYVENLKKTPFETSKLVIWLEAKQQEAGIISQIINPLKNLVPICQDKELECILTDKTKKYMLTLSFGIIASNSHPFLKVMTDYLNNPEDSDDLNESFKDHWIHSDSLHNIFHKQIDIFKQFAYHNQENVKLKSLMEASPDHKGVVHFPGEMFLYVDGSRKPFQPPSAPGAIDLINSGENEIKIKWEAPQNGLKDIQQYCISYKFDYADDDAVNWRKTVSKSNQTQCRISNLQPDTSYVFKVAAVCEAGNSAFSSPSVPFATKPLPSLAEKSLVDCTLLSPPSEGVPAWYLVPLKQTYHNKQIRLRKYEVGIASQRVVTTKVVLIVGATGSGKTTLINAMINYLLGTKMNNEFRLKLINESLKESQAHSQTQYITAYTIHWQPGSRISYNLIIVDTPGYGDTRGIAQDEYVTHQIKEFLEMKGYAAIDQIDAVGFVAQASAVRLTDTQKYIFDTVLSIFGRDIADNVFMMLTFADGRAPPALDAIHTHKLPYKAYFKFNNSVFTPSSTTTDKRTYHPANSRTSETQTFDDLFWQLAEESFSKFFMSFSSVETQSLTLTKQVLQERHYLECTIESFQQQIESGINHLTRLRQELIFVEQFEAEKTANKNFTREIQVPKTRRVYFKEAGRHVTNCLNCNVTCHAHCRVRDDDQKFKCSAMNNLGDPNTTCRICIGHCDWRVHVNRDHTFEEYMEEETITIEDLKKRYEYADQSLSDKDNLLTGMYEECNKIQIRVIEDIEAVRGSLQRLDEIAMKRNPMTTVEYIDVLINSTKQERKPGWIERLEQLCIARERAEMIQKMEKDGQPYDPFHEFREEIKRVASMKCNKKRGLAKTIKEYFGIR